MRRRPRSTLIGGVVVVVAILGGASLTESVTKGLLLNVGVGLALLLALDLNVAQWLDAVVKAEGEAKERIAEAARLVEEAETVLDYKYAVHDYLKLPRPDKIGGNFPGWDD